MKKLLKTAFILPVIVIAAVVFVVILVKAKKPIEHTEQTFPVRTVETITVKAIPFRARALAFGYVEPAILLKSKSEISGKISYRHPKLKKGESLKKGTVVLRIEPTSYKISLNQSQAGLENSQSQLKQLDAEKKSTRRSLVIAQKNLDVGLKELKRIQTIWDKRLIARSVLDAEEQKVLQLRQQVEEINGRLDTYVSRKSAIQAQIRQSRSQVDQSVDTLERTEIRLPFDARVGSVWVEKGEFVAPGGALFEASGIQAIEINAQLPTQQFRPLLFGLSEPMPSIKNPADLSVMLSKIKLQAKVQLVNTVDTSQSWAGELIRISESVDPTRDTIGLVVAVNNPYKGIIPGKRPPLLKGMYVSVALIAPAQLAMVIPRKALHQGRVYVERDKQLIIKKVDIRYIQGDLIVLNSGLDEGDHLIISDVIPVIEGLPLKPLLNHDYQQSVLDKAAYHFVSDMP